MSLAKSLFSFYINSSLHVAFSVLALTGVTIHHFEISGDIDLLVFIFFATITGYNFVKYAQVAKLHHRSLTKNLRLIQVFSFFCFLGLIYFTFQQPLAVIITAGLLAALNILYALPLLSQSNLRSIAGIKIFVIALVWAGTTVLLPVISMQEISGSVWIEFVQRFLFILVLMLPFEIRDLQYDKPELGTIPHLIGIRRTRYAGIILLCIILMMEFFDTTQTIEHILVLVLIEIVLLIFLMNSTTHQRKYFSSFWVEGIPILWWALLLLF